MGDTQSHAVMNDSTTTILMVTHYEACTTGESASGAAPCRTGASSIVVDGAMIQATIRAKKARNAMAINMVVLLSGTAGNVR